jgi:hypothetical protein
MHNLVNEIGARGLRQGTSQEPDQGVQESGRYAEQCADDCADLLQGLVRSAFDKSKPPFCPVERPWLISKDAALRLHIRRQQHLGWPRRCVAGDRADYRSRIKGIVRPISQDKRWSPS